MTSGFSHSFTNSPTLSRHARVESRSERRSSHVLIRMGLAQNQVWSQSVAVGTGHQKEWICRPIQCYCAHYLWWLCGGEDCVCLIELLSLILVILLRLYCRDCASACVSVGVWNTDKELFSSFWSCISLNNSAKSINLVAVWSDYRH